ncbi:HEAT repeat domain-containing protein [Methanoculleus bourgensis]|uniref:HEAT repeat domain-containing protein n=1 Tax=Methanoculleus bourgensis TaxID=83986 RepID=UPI0022EE93D1|nr:HEAT repeat domain-containing protein [Methanoculleus bourgensis]GLI47301.1 hypothetical protein MBOURGENBZM_20930 [Methanoculleus bourgensis]
MKREKSTATDQYIHNLQHAPDRRDRRAAAAFLGKCKDDESLNALIAASHGDSESGVRIFAARALAKRGDPHATEAFISVFNNALECGDAADAEFKEYAQILGRLEDKRAISTLITGLSSERPEAREIVRDILLKEVGTDAVPSLIDALESPDIWILMGAASILSRMGYGVTPPLLGLPGVALLVEGLADPDRHVRLAATRTLGLIDFEGVFKDADWSKTITAAIDGLLPVMTDKDQDIRKEAFLSLGTLGGILYRYGISHRDPSLAQGVLDALTGVLSDEDVQVRVWAAKALGLYGTDECVAPLRELLQGQDVLVKEAAADALMMIPKQEAVDTIIDGLEDPEPEVRRVVASSLGRSLHKSLEQPPRKLPTRSQPVYMRVPESVSTITSALAKRADDPDEHVRREVRLGLAMFERAFPGDRGLVSPGAFFLAEPPQFERALPGDRGPVRMPCAPAPAPAVLLPSSQLDHTEEKESPVDTVIETAVTGPTEPRYPHVDFFHDEPEQNLVGDEEPLVRQTPYWMRVAVDLTKPKTGEPVPPILEPRQKHPVNIIVAVDGDDFEITEAVQTLILPPTGRSIVPARFKIQALKETIDPNARSTINIRLYYNWFLIAKITVEAEVVNKTEKTPISRFGLKRPIKISHQPLVREFPDPATVIPRDMNVGIKKKGDIYELKFGFFKKDGKTDGPFIGSLHIDEEYLKDSLIRVRKCLEDIATSKTFKTQLECDNSEFREKFHKLAYEGCRLWNLLFKSEHDGAMFSIGKWLKDNPLPEDSIIQISFEDKGSTDFIFPWALLYDKELPEKVYDKKLDLNGFWGTRYCIEQLLCPTSCKRDGAVSTDNKKLRLCYMFCGKFVEYTQDQQKFFEGFADSNSGRFEINGPIISAEACCDLLKTCDCDCDILYFFAHGQTRDRQTNKDTYIELAGGKVYLERLKSKYDDVRDWKAMPIVFLNTCELGEVTPTFSNDSFVKFFLDRGASCVIGTECTMSAVFAHHFAKEFFKGLLGGESVGKAALKASRDFMMDGKTNNLLGLAYTIYGSVTTYFDPPPIQRPAETGSMGRTSGNG